MAQTVQHLIARLIRQSEDEARKVINIESRVFKELRNAIKSNEAAIVPVIDYIMKSATKSECPRRRLYLSFIDYFFNRSHPFRLAVINSLKEVLHIFVEIDPLHRPLPGPKEEGSELKIEAIKAIKVWHEKFAVGYERLQSVADFLSTSKAMDFKRASAALLVERQREEEKTRKQRDSADRTAEFITKKYDIVKEDIGRCITEVKNALRILVPVFSEEDSSSAFQESCLSEPSTSGFNKNLHGYSVNQTITVILKHSMPEIKLSSENESIVSTLRDGRIMLNYYRKHVTKWISRLSESKCDQHDIANELIRVKAILDSECVRIAELNIPNVRRKNKTESDSEESDFEDVPEKEIENFVPHFDEIDDHVMKRIREMESASNDKNNLNHDSIMDQPCCSKTVVEDIKPLNSIPIVSFGLDLQYWGDEKRGPVEIPKNNADCHRFWRAPDEDSTSKEQESVYTTRVMTFIGEGRKPTKACRARLNNEKLCPRMDVEKCPVHGVIILRDDEGFPIEEIDGASHLISSLTKKHSDKEEQEFLNDIEAATGKSLTISPSKRGNRKIKKDVPEGKVVRERLEKKLLDKRTVKRVSEALDAIRKAKIQKKFGNQFVHALSKK